MTSIKCRTVQDGQPTEQDIICSLDQGMICSRDGQICPDLEYQIQCTCKKDNVYYLDQRDIYFSGKTAQAIMTVDADMSMCNPSKPMLPHKSKCNIYYQCTQVSSPLHFLPALMRQHDFI